MMMRADMNVLIAITQLLRKGMTTLHDLNSAVKRSKQPTLTFNRFSHDHAEWS